MSAVQQQSTKQRMLTRLRILLATLGLVLMGVMGMATPAYADATLCSGYVGCVYTGYGDHGYGANNGNMYWTMYAGHNCTNYAAYMAIQNGASTPSHNLGSAGEWETNASASGVPVNSTPAVGAIAQWNYGHVAYVEAVNSDGSITISEDNYGGDFHWRVITSNGNWPDNFIHFADITPSGGEMLWKLRNNKSAGTADMSFLYGPDTAMPVTGDWDGNGTVTIGVARDGASELSWQLRNGNSAGSASITTMYGGLTDIPIAGNWDGVGTTTVGIVRRDTTTGQLLWKLSNNNGTPYATFYYGASTDIPVVGDWDGDGIVTIGIVRRDAASDQLIWKLRNSNSAGAADVTFYYGASTATPVTGDWDSNGTTTVGTVRHDDGTSELLWQLRDVNSGGSAAYTFHYGASTDHPVTGDWDGNGTTTIGIVRY